MVLVNLVQFRYINFAFVENKGGFFFHCSFSISTFKTCSAQVVTIFLYVFPYSYSIASAFFHMVDQLHKTQ